MTTYETPLTALGLDQKWLLKESKILIRARVIKTASAYVPVPEDVPGSTEEEPQVYCEQLQDKCRVGCQRCQRD